MPHLTSLPLVARWPLRAAIALGAILLPTPAVAQGDLPSYQSRDQFVVGRIGEAPTGAPVLGAMILLVDSEGRQLARVLSAEDGRFRLHVPRPGRYRLRVDRIGFTSVTSEPMDVAPGATVERDVRASVRPVQLAGIDVDGARRCYVRPADGLAAAQLWEEARKALAATKWTSEREMYRFSWMHFERRVDPVRQRVTSEQRTFRRSLTPQPFKAFDPAYLAEHGFVTTLPDGQWEYAAPDASVLLSDPFLDTHCFRIERGEGERGGLLGLAFDPLPGRRMAEVSGVLWIDPQSARLRALDYRYLNLHPELRDDAVGGELLFAELPNGTWIVTEWKIRMPRAQNQWDPLGLASRLRLLAYEDEGGVVQQAATTTGRLAFDVKSGGLVGMVRDSLGRPASGARVWIYGTSFTTHADETGAFAFSGLGRGTWTVASTLASLEALGHVTEVDVEIKGVETGTADVSLPSAREVALERCRRSPPDEGQAVLAGRLLDATHVAMAGAMIWARWLDYSFTFAVDDVVDADDPDFAKVIGAEIREKEGGIAQVTDEDGVFLFCDVPTYHTIHVRPAVAVPQPGDWELPIWLEGGTDAMVVEIVMPKAGAAP